MTEKTTDNAIEKLADAFQKISEKSATDMGSGGARACGILAIVFGSGGVDPARLKQLNVDWIPHMGNVFPKIQIQFFGKDEPWTPDSKLLATVDKALNLPE